MGKGVRLRRCKRRDRILPRLYTQSSLDSAMRFRRDGSDSATLRRCVGCVWRQRRGWPCRCRPWTAHAIDALRRRQRAVMTPLRLFQN